MSIGAAGCGYDLRNHGGLCGCYNEVDNKPHCLKHHTDLEVHHITGEPFRCKRCLGGFNWPSLRWAWLNRKR